MGLVLRTFQHSKICSDALNWASSTDSNPGSGAQPRTYRAVDHRNEVAACINAGSRKAGVTSASS